eukprot:SM000354S13409  [mRNA]  locus=s354:66647:69399:- [translate_table: standard]
MCFDPVLSPAVYGASGAIFLAWNVKRWLRSGAQDSQDWPAAPLEDVQAIVHYCQLVQGAYAREPGDIPARAPFVQSNDVVRFVGWPNGPVEDAMCPPHFVYTDAASAEVVLAIRGMRMSCPTGRCCPTDGASRRGYVHKGVYGAARWLCDRTADCLRQQLVRVAGYGCGSARLVIVGHSLGAGIAAVLAMILADHARELLGVDRAALHCYAFAPPRVVSLDLAMAYSDIVRGIVLQDDFWPRASTSVIAKCFISVLCGDCTPQAKPTTNLNCAPEEHALQAAHAECWRGPISGKRLFSYCLSFYTRVTSCSNAARPAITHMRYQIYNCSNAARPAVTHMKVRLPDCDHSLVPVLARRLRSCSNHTYRVLKANPDGARFEKIVLSQRTFSDHHIRSYQKALDKALCAITAVDLEAVDGYSMGTSDAFRVWSDHVSTGSTSSEILSSTADTAIPRA